jgi:hypothetical protein
VEKGNEDGLSISSVASCQNLWALIMDAGTGFTAQVYELAHVFLPKVRSPAQSERNQEICSPKSAEKRNIARYFIRGGWRQLFSGHLFGR